MEKERVTTKSKAIDVTELWKVNGKEVIAFFAEVFSERLEVPSVPRVKAARPNRNGAAFAASSSTPRLDSLKQPERSRQREFFTAPQLQSLLDEYITSHSLINPRNGEHVILDAPLQAIVASLQKPSKKKAGNKSESKAPVAVDDATSITREDLLSKLTTAMEKWVSVSEGGKNGVLQ